MPLKIILLVVALVQAAAPAVLFFDGFDQKSGRPPTPIVPAAYAFSIWGLIYALAVLFALLQLVERQAHPLLKRIAGPAILLFALSTLWLSFARFGPEWATVPTIIVMLVAAVLTLVRAEESGAPARSASKWCAAILFGLYAGWLTIATFANAIEIALDLGFSFLGLSLDAWTIGALFAGIGIACRIAFAAGGNGFYAAAIIWGLIAIAVANGGAGRWPVLAASLVGASAIALATIFARRRERGVAPSTAFGS